MVEAEFDSQPMSCCGLRTTYLRVRLQQSALG